MSAVRSARSAGRCARRRCWPPLIAGRSGRSEACATPYAAELLNPANARGRLEWETASARSMAPGPTSAATSGLSPRGDLAGRRRHTTTEHAGPASSRRPSVGTGGGRARWATATAGCGARSVTGTGDASARPASCSPTASTCCCSTAPRGRTRATPGRCPAGRATATRTPSPRRCARRARRPTLDPRLVTPIGSWVDDHGGWSYTTVLATHRAGGAGAGRQRGERGGPLVDDSGRRHAAAAPRVRRRLAASARHRSTVPAPTTHRPLPSIAPTR